MNTILASVAGIEEGFFDVVWHNMPNAAFAIASIGVIVFVVYKVVTFFTALKQSIVDINNSFINYKPEVASIHTRMDKDSMILKKSVESLEIGQRTVEISLVKTDAKVDALRSEINLKFEKVDERFVSLHKEMNMRFEKVDEKFISLRNEMSARFEKVDECFTYLHKEMDVRFEKVDFKFKLIDERFDRLENKMDKVIDILMSNREDKALSPLRKS